MKYFTLLLVGSALAAAPALAQTAPAQPTQQANAQTGGAASAVSVTPGTAVVDASGAPVGTIESVTPQGAVVSTGTAKATLPLNAFAKRDAGVAISMTKAQLEQAVSSAAAAAVPDFAVGGAIADSAGANVGTVESVSGDQVTVKLASGSQAVLPKNAFAKGATGGLTIGMTAAQLDAAVKAAQPQGGGAD
ncbi:hypothetical protein [uncultured Sphingomonas sp.]|uniref:hypothetical protein n=1 Tax=uncultured Sphingomonas sp. TaxID=158754 RepID=UPI0025FC3A9E|nr:hypothetical protein [uncultured Sphingomonas sp.]